MNKISLFLCIIWMAQTAFAADGGPIDAGQRIDAAQLGADVVDNSVADAGLSDDVYQGADKTDKVEKKIEQVAPEPRPNRNDRLEQELRKEMLEDARLLAEVETEIQSLEVAAKQIASAQQEEQDELEIAQTQAGRRHSAALSIEKHTAAGDNLFDEVKRAQEVAVRKSVAALRARRAQMKETHVSSRSVYNRVTSLVANKKVHPETEEVLTKTREKLVELDALFRDTSALETWYEFAQSWHALASENNEIRLALFNGNKLTPGKRQRVTDMSPGDAHDFVSEMEVLFGTFRYYGEDRLKTIPEQPAKIQSQAPGLLWVFTKAVALILFGLWGWRRARRLKDDVRTNLAKRFKKVKSARKFTAWWTVLESVLPSLYIIFLARWLRNMVSEVGPQPETHFVFQVIIWVAFARFCSQLTHKTILQLVRNRHSISLPTRVKILSSVRWVLRYTLLVFFLLNEVIEPLGAWLLLRLVRSVFYFGYVPIFLWLTWRWREEIEVGVKESWPEGRLAQRLTSATSYGKFLWCIPSVFWLAGNAIAAIGHDFLLGFESTRRALSYLLRLQFERTSNKSVDDAPPEMAPEIKAAFSALTSPEPALLIQRFSFSKELKERLSDFPDRGRSSGNSVLVTAEQGMGRSVWLEQMTKSVPEDMRAITITPRKRLRKRSAFYRTIAKSIDPEFDVSNPKIDHIVELLKDKRTAFFLDRLEFHFLRTIGGHDAIDALLELITATVDCAYWVVTISAPAERYLHQIRELRFGFHDHYELKAWSEEELTNLVMRRVQRSDFEVNFQEAGQRGLDALADASAVETKAGFMGLMWEFSRGNPSVAQNFWMRSLVLNPDKSLSVKPYAAPSPDMLEGISEAGRFVLSTCYLHNALTPADFARVLNMPRAQVESEVSRGVSRGYFCEEPSVRGAYRISVHWWEATTRFLKRKKLSM